MLEAIVSPANNEGLWTGLIFVWHGEIILPLGGKMFNPETVELHRKHGKEYASWADFTELRERYREALDCIVGMVGSNTDAMAVLGRAGLVKDNGHDLNPAPKAAPALF